MIATIWWVFFATVAFTLGLRFLKFEKGNKQGDTTIYARDVVAFALIGLSFLGAFVGTQTFQAEAAGGGGGGLATYRCVDSSNPVIVTNALCYGPGNSGSVSNTNSTLCVLNGANNCTVCPLSPSPCWTKVQHGFGSCTIPTGQNICHITATFNPAYTVKPFVEGEFNGTVPIPTVTLQFTNTVNENIPLIFQAVNNATWFNMPTTDTELYGKNSTRLTWTVPTVFTSQSAQVCVNFESAANIPALTVQFSTTANGPWNYLGDASFYASNPGFIGLTCGPIEQAGFGMATLTQGTQYYFRVVGNDGFGPANDSFGTIELQISGTALSTVTIHPAITCAVTQIPSTITLTTAAIYAQCGNTPIDLTKTYTLNWWAGVPA